MNHYLGMRDPKGNAVVKMNGVSFDPARSQQLRNHSPNGFEWGYGGSGPSQLALALLLEELDEEKRPEPLSGLQMGRYRPTGKRMDDG